MATVRLTGNLRNPSKKEWIGSVEIDDDGNLERSLEQVPEAIYDAIERGMAQQYREGTINLEAGKAVHWLVD
jgi:hypothetical protein